MSSRQNKRLKLLAIVSHDLRAPLNRILGLAHLLDRSSENLDEEQKEYLNKIHQLTSDGLKMVDNIMDAYVLAEDVIAMHGEPVNVEELISSQIGKATDIARRKNIQIAFHVSPLADIITDKSFLNRIVEGLLLNAIKFSKQDTHITITVQEKEQSILIIIADQGPGIGKEDQQLLFKRFQRLSAYPTAGESATGLGLSIIRILIEKMGAKIHCESDLGKGTKWMITLPKKPH